MNPFHQPEALFPAWFPYAYPIEFVQLTFATVGMLLSLRGTWDAWRDIDFIVRSGLNGAREFVGRRNLFEEGVRLLVHILFVGNGIVTILYPPPEPGLALTDARYFQFVVTRSVMTAASALLMLKSYRDLRDRAYLRSLLDRP